MFMSRSEGGATPPVQHARALEFRPDETLVYALRFNGPKYRAFRLTTLYEGTGEGLAGVPSRVESVVSDGAAQRSMVRSVAVTFDGVVALGPKAVSLRRGDGALIGFQLASSVVGGKTVAVLTFAGPGFMGGSLADGDYLLTIRTDRVRDRWGRELDGDGDGAEGGDQVDGIFRLDGDGDLLDLWRFLDTFGRKEGDAKYLWYFDVNGDDRIGVTDLMAFAFWFGRRL